MKQPTRTKQNKTNKIVKLYSITRTPYLAGIYRPILSKIEQIVKNSLAMSSSTHPTKSLNLRKVGLNSLSFPQMTMSVLYNPSREQLLLLKRNRRLSVSWEAAAGRLSATWGPESSASWLCSASAFLLAWRGHRTETCSRGLDARATGCNSPVMLCPCICWTSDLRASAGQAWGLGSGL